jgi:hypothetical protein
MYLEIDYIYVIESMCIAGYLNLFKPFLRVGYEIKHFDSDKNWKNSIRERPFIGRLSIIKKKIKIK